MEHSAVGQEVGSEEDAVLDLRSPDPVGVAAPDRKKWTLFLSAFIIAIFVKEREKSGHEISGLGWSDVLFVP